MDRRYYNAMTYAAPSNAIEEVIWPYDVPQRGAYNDRRTVMGSSRNMPQPVAGYPGSQSGEGMRRPDAMFSQQYLDPVQPGMVGTPSGPVEESSSAELERMLQMIGGYGAGSVGGAVGFGLGSYPGAAVGMAPGLAASINADNPDIQNVWAHQIAQYLRRRARGLDW